MININLIEVEGELKSLKEESLFFYCSVIEFSVRSSKKGNMFGVLEVADDHGQIKFFLFGQDLVNFERHGIKGKQLLIKGQAEKQKFSDNYKFRIKEIQSLF